jgi:multiple sugar transport system ATP-binding protein
MGRAVIRQPQVFLMDEPLSNLDAQLRVHMRGEIEALQKRLGVTTVYVTHDQVEAMTMGDRVAVLRDGLLQQVDTPTNIYDRPANLFVAGFIGSPPMNLAQARIESRNGSLAVGFGDQLVGIPPEVTKDRNLDAWAGREVTAGIRPEDLVPAGDGATGPRLSGKVERVEELGPEVLVYFAVNAPGPKGGSVAAVVAGEQLESAPLTAASGTVFCATFEARSAVRIGDTIEVAVDANRLHFFDPETDAAV